MDIRNGDSVERPSGTTPSTLDWRREAGKHESTRWRTATERRLSAFERYEVLGWDEV